MPSKSNRFKNYDEHYVRYAEASLVGRTAHDALRLDRSRELGAATIIKDIRHKQIMLDIINIQPKMTGMTSTEFITLYRSRVDELDVLAQLAIYRTELDFPEHTYGLTDVIEL